jgi:hypothetical protein
MARVRFILVVILLGATVIFAGGVTPAHAVSCGDILGPGGNFQLQQNLDCPGPARALTVKDGAILLWPALKEIPIPKNFKASDYLSWRTSHWSAKF